MGQAERGPRTKGVRGPRSADGALGRDALRFHGRDLLDLRRRCRGRIDAVQFANHVRDEIALVLGLRLLDQLAHPLSSLLLIDAFPDEHHHVRRRRLLMEDVLASDAQPLEHLPVRARALTGLNALAELTPFPRFRDRENLHGKRVCLHVLLPSLRGEPGRVLSLHQAYVASRKGASGPRRLPRRSQRSHHPSCDPTISPTACGVRPIPIEARSARGAFLDAEPSEGRSEPAVLTDTWRASRMASRTDGGPRVLRAKGVEWPYVHPHGEDPQVAPARQDVLASPGRAKHAVDGAEE